MKAIFTQNEKRGERICWVDDEDYDYIVGFGGWYDGGYYPQYVRKEGSTKNTTYLMHAVVWERHFGPVPQGMMVDHADRNGFNNQKENLRLATRAQNRMNSKPASHNQSTYKGVHLDPRHGGRYQAMIRHEGKLHHIGMFSNGEDAAYAFNICAERLQGEFAHLNDVPFSLEATEAVLSNAKLMALMDRASKTPVEYVNL